MSDCQMSFDFLLFSCINKMLLKSKKVFHG